MKTILALFLCVMPLALGASPVSLLNLKRDAKACAETWNRGDYEGFVKWLSERVVADAAARATKVAEIKQSLGYLKPLGVTTMHVTLGEPKEVKTFGSWQVALLPLGVMLEGPEGKMTGEDSFLAVSRDQGKTWKFVILFNASPRQLAQYFPEFQGKLKIPASPPPTFEPANPRRSGSGRP